MYILIFRMEDDKVYWYSNVSDSLIIPGACV